MSENSDDCSDHDITMNEDSLDESYSDYGNPDEDAYARYYRNPLEHHIPAGMRSYVRKLSLDVGKEDYKYIKYNYNTYIICMFLIK